MSNLAALMSSASVEWRTPQWLYLDLDEEFSFNVDVAATAENALCSAFYTREDNALERAWAPHRCWCNPPYGKRIGEWIKKAAMERELGALVVMLIPARLDVAAWHDHILQPLDHLSTGRFAVTTRPGVEVRFIRGRLAFGKTDHEGGNATFPSAVVIFRPRKHHAPN